MNKQIVLKLINEQLPQFNHLCIKKIKKVNNHNKFHLGQNSNEHMIIRMPSHEKYATQVEKEYFWLPFLAKNLSIKVPEIISLLNPNALYPYKWIVCSKAKTQKLIKELASFLKELHSIDINNLEKQAKKNFPNAKPPEPSEYNFL